MIMNGPATPRIEKSVSSLMLSPRESEKLVIYQVAELARRRRERGVKLNLPESIALIAEGVMEGVPELMNLVQVEATFRTGTQLVSVSNPVS